MQIQTLKPLEIFDKKSFTISCYMGKARAGKTLSMVSDGHDIFMAIKLKVNELKQKKVLTAYEKELLETYTNFEIWSNLKLNPKIFGNYKLITVDFLKEFYQKKGVVQNKLLLLDDIFKNVDSRKSASELNIVLNYFFTEIGKSQNILLYVSHFARRVDWVLRSFTEFFVLCQKGKLYDVILNNDIFKDVWIEDTDYYSPNETPETMIIKKSYYTEFFDFLKDDNSSKKQIHHKEYLKASKVFKYYNTKQIIEMSKNAEKNSRDNAE